MLFEDVSNQYQGRSLVGYRARATRKADDPQIVLCLQGGGALAAFQAGVYKALADQKLMPDWVLGVSSGALNAAVIAGNEEQDRFSKLELLWKRLWRSPWDLPAVGHQGRGLRELSRQWDAFLTAFGKPNFYLPKLNNPLVNPAALSFYQQTPLRRALDKVVNFKYIDRSPIRLSVGCSDIERGIVRFFDNRQDIVLDDDAPSSIPGTVQLVRRPKRTAAPKAKKTKVREDHLLAASAFPPGAEAVTIEDTQYWDAGVLDNSPLEAVLKEVSVGQAGARQQKFLVFLVDLWSRESDLPKDLPGIVWRSMELQHASRVSSDVEQFMARVVRQPNRAAVEVLHVTYQTPNASPIDPVDFTARSIAERLRCGEEQTLAVIKDWRKLHAVKPEEERWQAASCYRRYHAGTACGTPRWTKRM